MKKLNLLLGILIGMIIISCSSDDATENNNSEKKLTRITYQNLSDQSQYTLNITYDNNNNLTEVTSNGQLIQKYTYNSLNKVIGYSLYNYENQILSFEENLSIAYNIDNKISNLIEIFISYNPDGNISNESSTNHNITYGNNSIMRLSDDFANTKIEYTLSNNLFTGIKVYRNSILKSDMTFTYDAGGNCISGIGPIDEGSLDSTTNDIELSVLYGTEEKNTVFNAFFDFNILTRTSFYNIRQTLINQQGDKYVEQIQWYQYSDYSYKETNDNLFDSDGYIISRTLSDFPDYPNNSMITYTWE